MKITRLLSTIVLLLWSGYLWAQTPNFIVIIADDLGYSDVGYHGLRTDIPTPNIDALANKGVQFSEGYVTAPVCAPSRAGLLTGVYQQRFGFKDNPGPFRPSPEIVPGISHDYPTIAQELKKVGYNTAAIGKWHLGGQEDNSFIPTGKGFDYYYGFLGGASSYYFEDHATQFFLENDQPIQTPNRYLTSLFGDKAVEYILQQDKAKPFFMYWAPNAVHSPLQAPEEVLEKFKHIKDPKRQKLVAMQYVMDQNIGRIVDALETKGLMDNTMIVFISDNGGKPHENASYNLPLNGAKGSLFDGGIRVPYFMYYPKMIKEGQKYDEMVSSLDIMPTFLSLANANATQELSGVNLLPYISKEISEKPHDKLYWKNANKWGVRDQDWKLFYDQDSDKVRLFHLAKDAYEKEDVYDQYPEQVERLLKAYQEWDYQNASFSWGWNPAAIGKYKTENQFTFEELISEKLASEEFADVMVIENPAKTGINTSNKVLHLKVDQHHEKYFLSARHSPMMKRGNKVAHIKVKSKQNFRLNLTMIDDKKGNVSAYAHKEYNGNDEWQDLVFDFTDWKGMKSKGIELSFEGLENNEDIYLDDIWWNVQKKEIKNNETVRVENIQVYKSIFQKDKQVLVWKPIPNVNAYTIYHNEEVIGTADQHFHLLPMDYQLKDIKISTKPKLFDN
ncbi:sulfatase-like hydrolase/transferase [Flammeovirga sp. SJP92]|uniref:sulfatase-like hydrolase/transferase n=1 Tax=Flammeovirga sp. SJP92 TaxID=1775430 RepID=UPI000AB48EBC|nr:sulfatase-like hydrolase/transferase [Flammeovirga sp. SJP92]